MLPDIWQRSFIYVGYFNSFSVIKMWISQFPELNQFKIHDQLRIFLKYVFCANDIHQWSQSVKVWEIHCTLQVGFNIPIVKYTTTSVYRFIDGAYLFENLNLLFTAIYKWISTTTAYVETTMLICIQMYVLFALHFKTKLSW